MPLRIPHAARGLIAGPFSAPACVANPLLSTSARTTSPLRSPPGPAFHQPFTPTQSITLRFCSTSTRWRPEMAEQGSKEVRKYLEQSHNRIFENNRKWADEMKKKNPAFFTDLSAGQKPDYLWIGCSDSRIPAEAITGLDPGEMFIHRNIANLVNNIDLNVMSVINYAVRHLKVKHIIVCGHYGCGGVKAAMTPKDLGLLNPWLRNIRDVYRLHQDELDAIVANGGSEEDKYNRLVELNVHEQCRNIIKTAAVQKCWAENEFPVVHGWVFGFHDGLLKDLKFDHEGQLKEIQKIYNLTDES